MKLLDTDVIVNHFQGHQPTLSFIADNLAAGEILAVSVVALTELTSELRPKEAERLPRLVGLFLVLDVTEPISRLAAVYLRQYRLSHHLELGDALIAATAAHVLADLITHNLARYPMRDIRVIVPFGR